MWIVTNGKVFFGPFLRPEIAAGFLTRNETTLPTYCFVAPIKAGQDHEAVFTSSEREVA